MERTLKQVQQGQLIHNVYCPTVEQTIATCQSEMATLHEQQNVYFEVPFEQFNDVYRHFHENDAIIKGAFTYMQVRHIARTGNIHRLTMSEEGRIYFVEESISISAAISFAQSKWNSATREEAVENAVLTGLTVIGEAFAEEIIARQIKQTNTTEHINVDEGLKVAIQKNDTNEAIQKIATKAMKKARSVVEKKAMMLMNENFITGALVTGMIPSEKVERTIKAQMSTGRLVENVSKVIVSVASSIIGLAVGGGIGFAISNVGTTVISLIGGGIGLIVGSLLAAKIVKKMLKFFIKKDALEMLEIFNEELAAATEIFLLNEQELRQALNDFNVVYNLNEELRKMYTAKDRIAYAKALIEDELSRIVKLRMYLQIPTNEELYKVIERIQS